MNARQLFERLGAAPVEAPPKPTTKPPTERPGAPPRPNKYPNPFRRRLPNPGPMPRPKACEAKELPQNKNRRYQRWLDRKDAYRFKTHPVSGLSHAPDCDCNVCEKRRQQGPPEPFQESAKSLIQRLL